MVGGGLSKERLARMRETMAGYVSRREVPGMVTAVARRGETLVEAIGEKTIGSSDAVRADTIFRIASMTKPITAVAAMILVEECKLRLDEPLDNWLPELSDRRVLRRVDGPVDETVPARRSITLRDLLTFRAGYGFIVAAPQDAPIQRALAEAGLAPGPALASVPPNEYMVRLGRIPLAYQPGEHWLYHTCSDILGVLIARVAEQPLEAFFRERILVPLGMNDTGFSVPAAKLDRLATCYQVNTQTGTFDVFDDVKNSRWSKPPVFAAGGGGLVSTIDDVLAFGQMMLNFGKLGRERILSRPTIETMITDQLTAEQRAANAMFFGDNRSWGFGVSMVIKRDATASVPGRYGWEGGYGTSFSVDPHEGLVAILLTQVLWSSPQGPRVYHDFWTSVYQTLDD
jgi:CubicO group peptidase (beta-lactamase class C family)